VKLELIGPTSDTRSRSSAAINQDEGTDKSYSAQSKLQILFGVTYFAGRFLIKIRVEQDEGGYFTFGLFCIQLPISGQSAYSMGQTAQLQCITDLSQVL
jgi:hypothetical protein